MNAREIAEAVRTAKRTARDVTEEYLANIDARDDEINAFNLITRSNALDRADAIDEAISRGVDPGPLAGVPVAVKDNIVTKGVTTTCSSKILVNWTPPYESTVVRKLYQAGAVVIGKTNLDEFAMGGSTENSAFGPTLNPLDTRRVAGGSSGGSAAAVAADMAPIALGSDTGGSVRQPAAYCGVVGIKPTYGRVSRYGLVAFASSLDQIGTMATNVADAAFALEAIAGHDDLDSTSIDAKVPNYQSALSAGVDGLRVGVVKEMMAEGVTPDVRAQVERAIAALSANGADVGETSIPAVQYGLSAYYLIAPAEASSNLARYDGVRHGLRVEGSDVFDMFTKTRSEGFGAEVKRRIMLGTYALSSGYYDAYYAKAQRVRRLTIREFEAAFQHYDVLIAPTTPTVAFELGRNVGDLLAMYLNDVCTIPANLAGLPAMSVPFGAGADGLPVGVQLLAPAMAEATMLRAAAVLEGAAK